MNKPSAIIESLKSGWTMAVHAWPILTIVYFINLIIAVVFLGPISNLLSSVFENNSMAAQLVSGFDYTIIIDVINNHKEAVKIELPIRGKFNNTAS